jgi:hypothetical protein
MRVDIRHALAPFPVDSGPRRVAGGRASKGVRRLVWRGGWHLSIEIGLRLFRATH